MLLCTAGVGQNYLQSCHHILRFCDFFFYPVKQNICEMSAWCSSSDQHVSFECTKEAETTCSRNPTHSLMVVVKPVLKNYHRSIKKHKWVLEVIPSCPSSLSHQVRRPMNPPGISDELSLTVPHTFPLWSYSGSVKAQTGTFSEEVNFSLISSFDTVKCAFRLLKLTLLFLTVLRNLDKKQN